MAISKVTSKGLDPTDFNIDNDTLVVDSVNNRVGVGTATPTDGNLHVKGAAYDEQLAIERTDTSSKWGLAGADSGGFQIYDVNAGDATRMVIDSGGNVGIGTDSLTSTSGYKTLSISGSTGAQLAFQTGGVGKQYIFSTSTDLDIYNAQAGDIKFTTNAIERMRIDSSGRVTQPYQPAFYAYKSNANYTGNATITSWNGVPLNIGGHFNGTTGVFTAPIAGKYFFSGRALLNQTNSAGYYYLDFVYNGATASRMYKYVPASTYESFDISLMYNLNANDTVNLEVQVAGSSWYGVNSVYTQFIGRLLG